MKLSPIPDDEVFADHVVKTILPPPGRTDIDPADAQVTLVDEVPVFRFRVVPDGDDLERLAAGEPVWLSMWGHVVPFSVNLTVIEPMTADEAREIVARSDHDGRFTDCGGCREVVEARRVIADNQEEQRWLIPQKHESPQPNSTRSAPFTNVAMP